MEERIDNETVQQIDLISMLKDIGREWLTILLLAIAAALFADIWICATYQPEYRTSTTFVVTAKGMNNNIYQNLNSTKELASQFTEILGSNVLKKKVAQDLGMNNLNVKTSVDLVPETNLITFSVKAGTAAESYRVLQSVMENYNTVSDYAIKNVIIETIQQPSVAMASINPLDEKRTVMKVFVVAAGCLIALLAGISYIRDTIKNPGEVSTKLDTRLLGTIAYEKKSKALSMKRKKDYLSMLIQNPLRSFAYVESSKMAASRVRSYMDKEDIEVHKSLFPKESEVYGNFNRFFEDVFQNQVQIEIDGIQISALNYTEHLFYLICHAYKHFLHSGFGIRQVCDIVMYSNRYGERINWQLLLGWCREIYGEFFTAALYQIGEKYLIFDYEKACFPEEWRKIKVDESMLLRDILDAGVYGYEGMERVHSSNLTLHEVGRQWNGTKGNPVLRTIFLPYKSMKKDFTFLKKFPFLLPLAWLIRILKFGKELYRNNHKKLTGALKTGNRRIELMKKYKIIK